MPALSEWIKFGRHTRSFHIAVCHALIPILDVGLLCQQDSRTMSCVDLLKNFSRSTRTHDSHKRLFIFAPGQRKVCSATGRTDIHRWTEELFRFVLNLDHQDFKCVGGTHRRPVCRHVDNSCGQHEMALGGLLCHDTLRLEFSEGHFGR